VAHALADAPRPVPRSRRRRFVSALVRKRAGVIGLAIVLLIFRNRETVNIDEVDLLRW